MAVVSLLMWLGDEDLCAPTHPRFVVFECRLE
jgi:hypothetical protein